MSFLNHSKGFLEITTHPACLAFFSLLAFSEHHEQHLGWVSPTPDDSIIVLSSLTHATKGVQWVDAMASVLDLTPTPRY